MSKIYELTKKIHEEILNINEKYYLEIYLIGDKFMYFDEQNGYHEFFKNEIDENHPELWYNTILKLVAPQIRQILIDLKDVLGKNPDYEDIIDRANLHQKWANEATNNKDRCVHLRQYEGKLGQSIYCPKLQAEALCTKWLDGLEPMIDNEYEVVLTELLEILTKLNSK